MRIRQFVILPFLSILLTQEFHSSPTVIGLVVGVGFLAYALSSINCGHLSDRFGAKLVLIWSLLLAAFAFLGMYYCKNVIAYFFFNAALGVFRSAFNAASRAYIYLIVTEKQRLMAYGVQYMAINAGLGVGLLVGTLFAAHHADSIFVYVALSCGLLFFALVFFLPDKKVIRKETTVITFANTLKTVFRDYKLLLLIIGGLFMWIGYVQFDSIFPIYLVKEYPNGVIVYAEIVAVNAVLASTLQPFISKLMIDFSFMRQVIIGVIFFVIGYLMYVVFNSLLWFMLGMGLLTIGELIIMPLNDAWIGHLAHAERSGAYYAAGNFTMLGGGFGPALGGQIYDLFGIKVLFLLCAFITLMMLPLYKKALPAKESN